MVEANNIVDITSSSSYYYYRLSICIYTNTRSSSLSYQSQIHPPHTKKYTIHIFNVPFSAIRFVQTLSELSSTTQFPSLFLSLSLSHYSSHNTHTPTHNNTPTTKYTIHTFFNVPLSHYSSHNTHT